MTNKEIKEKNKKYWSLIYETFKIDILSYPKEFKLPKFCVLRLQGLKKGQYIANNNAQKYADYKYEDIYKAIKILTPTIKNSCVNKEFSDDKHKINYCLKILDSKINTILLAIKRKEKQTEEIKKMEITTHDEVMSNDDIDKLYRKKQNKAKINNKFKDML